VASSVSTSSAGGATLVAACPPGEFAVAYENDELSCTAIDAVVRDAVNAECALYFGWRDGCDGCGDPPSKWGRASGSGCHLGAGADDTCNTVQLGSDTVDLFGLNTDGDVDGNDKLYMSWHCVESLPEPSHDGPCAAGELLTSATTCTNARADIVGFARQNCYVYFGWRDGCDGCTDPPTKWGRANAVACNDQGGASTCSYADLDANKVLLFGLNSDGDVDGNDKLYLGFQCFGATPTMGPEAGGVCPDRQYLIGVYDDGSVECATLGPSVAAYIAQGCRHYFGWRDGCDGCTDPPTKWGVVSALGCTLGPGGDDTCSSAMLGGGTIELFGLNLDGDVDGNDKLYLGTKCY